MPTTRNRTARFLVPLAMVTLLGLTACSGGDEDASDDDVATLGAGDDEAADTDDSDDGGGTGARQLDPEFQDAMIEFAECMREQGIDFPDPQIEDGGGVVIAGPAGGDGGPPSESDMAEMDAANEVCQPILEAVEGSMPDVDPEQEQEMQDRALEFAECMREHGIDMPDPVFGENGRISQSVGGPDSPIDFDDEDFQDAQEDCRPEGEDGPGVIVGGGPAGGSTSGADEDEG
jgi:hypothetical protein